MASYLWRHRMCRSIKRALHLVRDIFQSDHRKPMAHFSVRRGQCIAVQRTNNHNDWKRKGTLSFFFLKLKSSLKRSAMFCYLGYQMISLSGECLIRSARQWQLHQSLYLYHLHNHRVLLRRQNLRVHRLPRDLRRPYLLRHCLLHPIASQGFERNILHLSILLAYQNLPGRTTAKVSESARKSPSPTLHQNL